MNIEFINLSDGTTAITNEKGNIKKIDTKISNEELMLENKIEITDNNIQETRKKINDNTVVIWLSKKMQKFQTFMVVVATVLGALVGGIYTALLLFTLGTIIGSTAALFFEIVGSISKKKLKGLEEKLKKAEELRSKYEKELKQEKVKKSVSNEKQTIINEPISLVKQNEAELPIIDEQLENAYSEGISSRSKLLVLTRKHQK